jgi:hypothetical protein
MDIALGLMGQEAGHFLSHGWELPNSNELGQPMVVFDTPSVRVILRPGGIPNNHELNRKRWINIINLAILLKMLIITINGLRS